MDLSTGSVMVLGALVCVAILVLCIAAWYNGYHHGEKDIQEQVRIRGHGEWRVTDGRCSKMAFYWYEPPKTEEELSEKAEA